MGLSGEKCPTLLPGKTIITSPTLKRRETDYNHGTIITSPTMKGPGLRRSFFLSSTHGTYVKVPGDDFEDKEITFIESKTGSGGFFTVVSVRETDINKPYRRVDRGLR